MTGLRWPVVAVMREEAGSAGCQEGAGRVGLLTLSRKALEGLWLPPSGSVWVHHVVWAGGGWETRKLSPSTDRYTPGRTDYLLLSTYSTPGTLCSPQTSLAAPPRPFFPASIPSALIQ